MIYLIIILFTTIICLVFLISTQKSSYNKKLLEMSDKCNFYFREISDLKKSINYYEEKEYNLNNGFDVIGGKLQKESLYDGKKALIGDYLPVSYNNTRNVLKSLGFTVDIVHTSKDLIDKIKYGEKYDIIFSNNVYRDGSGADCLKELKQLENFSTPVVVHTSSKNQEEYFVKDIGFDAYINKPVTSENIKPILKDLFGY